ncbi:MAG: hypothetical protein DRO98_07875, partial [Archaeoglobales archaeon]
MSRKSLKVGIATLLVLIAVATASATVYNSTGRYIEGYNVTVNTTGYFNTSIVGYALSFQVNNTLNSSATVFNIAGESGLSTNKTTANAGDWFWVNATTAGTYWVNVSNAANSSEYVNFTVQFTYSEQTAVDKTIKDSTETIAVKVYDIDKYYTKSDIGAYAMQFDFGETIKLYIYGLDSDNTTTVEIRDWDTDEAKFSDSFKASSKTYDLDTNQLYPGDFYIYIKNGQYVINGKNPSTMNVNYPQAITLHVAKPTISISLENKRTPIAKGDYAVVKVKVYGLSLPFNATLNVTGPMVQTYTQTLSFTDSREKTVKIPTAMFFASPYNGSTGTYTVSVKAGTEVESMDFKIEGIEVTLATPSTATLGTEVKLEGTTNIAETNSTDDDMVNGTNWVYVYVYLPNGSLVKEDGTILDASYADTTNYTRRCLVSSDGTWEHDTKFYFRTDWGTGSYRVTAMASTTSTLNDTETMYINVGEPEVKFEMDKYTFTRGEDIKFKGTASVKKGTKIWVESEDLNKLIEEVHKLRRDGSKYYLEVAVGSDGSWETEKLHINASAPKTSYTIDAYIIKDDGSKSDWKDTVTIRVAKAVLNASISRTSAPRGADITISGTTTLDYVYIFTDDWPVIENVGEIWSDTSEFNADEKAAINAKYKPYKLKVTDDTFSVQLTVNSSADTGTYTVYVIAPSDPPNVDPTEDAMAQFSLTITEFGFLHIPEKVVMVKGDEVDVYVSVNADPDDVKVTAEFEGHGAKVKEDDFGEFSKYNETAEGGWVYATLYPFYNDSEDKLMSTGEPDELLRPGMYTLTLHLYNRETNEEISEAETKVPVEVVSPELNV